MENNNGEITKEQFAAAILGVITKFLNEEPASDGDSDE